MSKKLKRSAVALVLAATMVFSSQGVLTAFAVGENETSTAVDVSALEPILDKEETVVVEEPGNTDETETPEVTEPCGITEGCTLPNGHPDECQVAPVDPPVEDENGEDETQPCTKAEGCTLENGHEGECVTEPVTPPEEENGEDETQPCEKTEGCTLPNGHEGECVVEENTEDTEDTQEPSEEDVAAAKNVSDLIGALPESSTLDPETTDVEALTAQVKAAREAYDKLTDAQKALVEKAVLDKLVALEGALEALQNTNVAAEGDVAKVGGTYYSNIDDAIESASENSTIELLLDDPDKTVEPTETFYKSLIFTGTGTLKYDIYGWRYNGNLTFDGPNVSLNCTTTSNAQPANNGEVVEWGIMVLGGSLNFTNGAKGTFSFDSKISHTSRVTTCAIFMNKDSEINITNQSSLKILGTNTAGVAGQALQLDGEYDAYLNVKGKSTFLIDGTNRGYVHSPIVYVEDSLYTIQNCTNNASNGGTFTAIRSEINFKDNAVNGLSATNLTISDNSTVICDGNGGYGIAADNVSVDGTSTVQVTNNATMNGFAGFMIRYSGTISKGATVIITGNQCKGLYLLYDSCEVTIEEGVDLTITDNYDSNAGGGIRNQGKNLSLPSNAVIFNNHAANAGDDIYCSRETSTITFGKVGSDWKLDGAPDCNHAITGWFDDSKDNRWNVHTGPVHAELYDEFDETTGLATVTGLKALKAAHPYQYDPDAPTEPSEPVDWETSKSKTATNLDKNYESQVTLSLPAAETVPVTDVVFVLDRSSSAGAARQEISSMMDNLLQIVNNSDAVINVGVVNFWYEADSGIALTALTNESIDSIKNAIMEGNLSGTNIEAGIDAAVAMLDASSTPDENKYMVLVTDGISHAWNGADGEVKTVWGQGTTQDATQVFNGANSYIYFDPSKTSFEDVFNTPANSELLNSPYEIGNVYVNGKITDQYEELIAAAPEYSNKFIHNGEYDKYYSGVEKGVYTAAHAYADAASKYKCINLYWDVSNYPIATEFMKWTNTQGKCYNITGEENLADAFANVEKDITYVVDAGSQVVDVIGGDDDGVNYDYDFDFVDVVSLTVGGEPLDYTKDGNTYNFGDPRDGIYPFVLTYYPDGLGVETMSAEDEDVIAGELFVLEINVPITVENSVQLKYTVKLMNPKTEAGDYGQYDEDGSENYPGLYTNNSAILYPVDSKGEIGEPESFPKPTVSYTVGGNDNPGTDPTPDPDPDPDRPSRPNRDDDDDWEPLPDAPVKDKPTTEVDVPEETETPTTEQPDKYNPETGDTTTVFAAMALAAVSLGGVVLLGRKKK